MNAAWLQIPAQRRIDILNQVSHITGLPPVAIEKDWWVTLTLNAIFNLEYATQFVFKGGTSLSKGWDLIERFSEDIDLAMDRRFFGYEGEISKTQIRNLRKKSCEFISNDFLQDLIIKFTDWKAINECTIYAQEITDSDKDPQVIEIHYKSVLDISDYLPQRVLVEVSSRSLMEPIMQRAITPVLNDVFPEQDFSVNSIEIPVVLPQRTFLEKIFLLHEEFSLSPFKIRVNRLSRHLYDIEKLMDTEHGKNALENVELYKNIVLHREKFNALRGLDYTNHKPESIRIIPPDNVFNEWEKDYQAMTENMIYGNSLSFSKLIDRIKELESRINKIKLL